MWMKFAICGTFQCACMRLYKLKSNPPITHIIWQEQLGYFCCWILQGSFPFWLPQACQHFVVVQTETQSLYFSNKTTRDPWSRLPYVRLSLQYKCTCIIDCNSLTHNPKITTTTTTTLWLVCFTYRMRLGNHHYYYLWCFCNCMYAHQLSVLSIQ